MFGDILKKLRKDKEMTQKDLGDMLNLSDRVIGYYEANRHFPDGDVLVKIADIFHVSLDYLLGRTNNPNAKVYETDINNNHYKIEFENDESVNLSQEDLKKLISHLQDVGFDVKKLIDKSKKEPK